MLAGRIIEIEPERAEYHEWAGRIAVNQEQLENALAHYHEAWVLQPGSQRIAMAYAELLTRNGEAVRAQEVLAGLEDLPATRLSRIAFALEADLRELRADLAFWRRVESPEGYLRVFPEGHFAELAGWMARPQ